MDAETRERLTRIETKFDSLIRSLDEHATDQKARCTNHGMRLQSLEVDRAKVVGASILGGSLAGIIGAWWQGRH